MSLKKFALLVFVLVASHFTSPEARAEAKYLADFRVGLAGSYDGHAVGNWFPQVAWAPQVNLNRFNLRADVGLTSLRDDRGSRVGVISAEMLMQFGFTDVLTVDFGGGVHSWGGGNGLGPALSVGVDFSHIYAGYTHVFLGRMDVNLLKAGVKLSIF